MLRQFNRFLVLAIIIAVTLYLTLLNSEQVSVRFGPSMQVTTYAGVVYLSAFALGCLACSMVAMFFGFKGYLRERRLMAFERKRQSFFDLFVRARNYMAAHEWGQARGIWEQVLRRDPDNIIARVELSKCLVHLDDVKEALRVLDATRISNHRSIEVLFFAAELNHQLGNNTGAVDNLALIVAETPHRRALEMARDISASIGRVEDALEYQNELDRNGYDADRSVEHRTRLTFEKIISSAPEESALKEQLRGFTKRNPAFIPALDKSAQLELASGKFDEAAELLVKAAKASKGDCARWRKVVDLWLHSAPGDFGRRVDRALSAARAAAQEASGIDKIHAEMGVVATLLAVNKVEDARKHLDGLQTLAEREKVRWNEDLNRPFVILRGLCLSRLGLAKDTAALWQQLAEPNGSHRTASGTQPVWSEEPSPIHSTP